ncbi:MAG: NADP-dependent oxidoreductase [Pseudomonadota bacterium]
MTDVMRQIVLQHYCDGAPRETDFALAESPLPEPREGQFRVRHIWASVDPGTRSRLSGGDSYAAALPLGKSIDGFNVGIVDASANDQYPVGTKVFCAGGWRTHSLQTGKGFIGKVPNIPGIPLSLWIGVLGVPGLTAWFGLKRVGEMAAGKRVLVTSAAGPVGATAGQLARAWGAEQVIGTAGSDAKCAWVKDTAGFDACLNYKTTPDLGAAIDAAMPDGIDLMFDNIGNAMVELCLPRMRLGGRITVSGQVADYNLEGDAIPPIRSTRPFITHRVRMEGLVVFDDARAFPEALEGMAAMIAAGDLKYAEDRFEGLDQMPAAFCGLFRGENFGRRVVQLSPEPAE